jgi:iron complex outermembrane receptor protein
VSKSDFLDGRLRVNTSVYYYLFNNIQVETQTAGGSGSQTWQNAAKAKAYGLDLAIAGRLTHELTVTPSIALGHTQYTKFRVSAAQCVSPLQVVLTRSVKLPVRRIGVTGWRFAQFGPLPG